MFGGGYRVGVSVCPVEMLPWPAPPAGVVDRPSRLAEVLPPAARTDGELAADLARITEIEAALAGYRVALVAELAARRPAAVDTPGSCSDPASGVEAEVDEFFSDELALVLNCSRTAASVWYEQARTLTERLPAPWARCPTGCWTGRGRGRSPPSWAARPTTRTRRSSPRSRPSSLPQAGTLSIRTLRDAVRAELVARDAAVSELRRRQAEKTANVTVQPARDGMADLVSGAADRDRRGDVRHGRPAGPDAENRRRYPPDRGAARRGAPRPDPAPVGHLPPAGHRPAGHHRPARRPRRHDHRRRRGRPRPAPWTACRSPPRT